MPIITLAGIASGAGNIICMGAVTLIAAHLSVESQDETGRWWDCYHRYYQFPPEFTDAIDDVLVAGGKLGVREFIGSGKYRPGMGEHRFNYGYWGFYHVGVKKLEHPTTKQLYYIAWVSPFDRGQDSIETFGEAIIQATRDLIQTFSIDTSGVEPKLLMLTKTCKSPRPHQQKVLGRVLDQYTSENNYNVKALITGPPGSGKTYIGKLLKLELESKIEGTSARLYDDFDPTAIGVNINKLALKYATASTPIIIVINEINRIYESVVDDTPDYDPRLKHARNKSSFNNMLDTMADTPHVIVIFTSEQSYSEIAEIKDFTSFIRPGRVDLISTMTDGTSDTRPNL